MTMQEASLQDGFLFVRKNLIGELTLGLLSLEVGRLVVRQASLACQPWRRYA
eukprot:CAMPEP_0118941988 /NCGR_PEP_ID=MMETSP1169-20130426/35133_1 /TAXON_ID=36882 /ORGANISM="Pyramimonas obovata, Strain CCMP722" /LENGTH=51 /DNA_ID=CAMNT_0006886893 /DNA_START=223 /DNA_END=378 /DNA_ORIENTATION=+